MFLWHILILLHWRLHATDKIRSVDINPTADSNHCNKCNLCKGDPSSNHRLYNMETDANLRKKQISIKIRIKKRFHDAKDTYELDSSSTLAVATEPQICFTSRPLTENSGNSCSHRKHAGFLCLFQNKNKSMNGFDVI